MSEPKTVPQEGKEQTSQAGEPKKLKPCCACPETKRTRDEWLVQILINGNCLFKLMIFFSIIEKGEENCTEFIQAHLTCMRKLGFNI